MNGRRLCELFLVSLFIASLCIGSAGAIRFDYTGIDKVDISWNEPYWGFELDCYKLYRDGTLLDTIYVRNHTYYRDESLDPGGTYTYRVQISTDSGTYDETADVTVGDPSGTLKLGDDVWADKRVTLGGNVGLGGNSLEIRDCIVETTSGDMKISGSGYLYVRGSELSKVTIDVTSPEGAVLNTSSDRAITLKGDNVTAEKVTIPYGTLHAIGDIGLYLNGNNAVADACNAQIFLSGTNGRVSNSAGAHAKIAATGSGHVIRDNTLTDQPGYGIRVYSANDTAVYGNTIRNVTRWQKSSTDTYNGIGIELYDCKKDFDIFDNRIDDIAYAGIYTTSRPDDPLENVSITYNNITGCGDYGIGAWGSQSEWSVDDNDIHDSETGIWLGGAQWTKVSDNRVTTSTFYGINFCGDDSEVTGNSVSHVEGTGISVSGHDNGGNQTVTGNRVAGYGSDDTYTYGYNLDYLRDAAVSENIAEYCYRGMRIAYSNNTLVRENEIYDCFGEDGVYFDEFYHGVVERNTLVNVSSTSNYAAVYVLYSGNSTFKDNTLDEAKWGFLFESSDLGLVLADNTIANSTGTLVRVKKSRWGEWDKQYQGPVDAVISGNTLVGVGSNYGIALSSADGIRVSGNRIDNCIQGVYISLCNGTIFSENFVNRTGTGLGTEAAYDSVITQNIFNVTDTGGTIGYQTENLTLSDNAFNGFKNEGLRINDFYENSIINNTLRASDPGAWDIVVNSPVTFSVENLTLEKNTVGVNHPTTVTVSRTDEPVKIRGVESPPNTPSPPDYSISRSDIGKWVEIQRVDGNFVDAGLNLTFHYTKEDLQGINESTLSIWKYNYTGWDPGYDEFDPWNGTRWNDLQNHEVGVQVQKLCIFAPLGGEPVHNLRLERDYATIQEALDDIELENGDTITVDPAYSGTKENLVIGKEIKLRPSSGISKDVTLTALDPYEPTVKVNSADVEIDGFVITGATGSQGVRVSGWDNMDLLNSKVTGNYFGVVIEASEGYTSRYSSVYNCEVTENAHGGVYLNGTRECNVIDSTISGAIGIGIMNGQANYIAGNTVTGATDAGIYVEGGSAHEVSGNTVTDGPIGIYLYGGSSQNIKTNTIKDTTDRGILLEGTGTTSVSENTVSTSPVGIGLQDSDDNTLSKNTVDVAAPGGGGRKVGLSLASSDGNTVSQCTVRDLASVGYSVTGLEFSGSSFGNTVDTCSFTGLEGSRTLGIDFGSSHNLVRNCTFNDLRGGPSGVAGILARQNTTSNTVRSSTFSALYAPENASAFLFDGSVNTTILGCTVGSVLPENTSAYAVFKNSAYTNVVADTALGPLAFIRDLRASGNLTAGNATSIPADGDDVENIGHYLALTSDGSGEASVSFTYTSGDLGGKNPALLSIWRHDGSSWQKVPAPNGVDTANQYVYAYNQTRFSLFAPMWSGSGLPVANFTGSPVSGAAPLTVQFTDHSSNAETWQWNFGDGGTSAEQNPSHTYTGIGQHTVVLEVGNAIGSDTNTRVHYIHVRDLPPSPPDTSENFTLRDNGTTVSDIGDVRQVSFNATIGNGTVSGNDIILTNENLNVTIRTDGLNTSGNVSTGNVTGVLLDSSPVNASVGTGAGNISVSFNASMGSYNPDLQIQTSIYDQPSSEASTAFSLAAAADGETITTIAYAVYFTKTNMSAGDAIQNAYIQLTASSAWVNAHGGVSAIRVFRQGDDGLYSSLATTYLRTNADGMMVFEAYSPNGFSSFGVSAVSAVSTGDGGGGGSSSGGGGTSVVTYDGSGVLTISSSGIVTRPIAVVTDDDTGKLTVPQGMQALDENDNALDSISIERIEETGEVPAAPAGALFSISDYVYECSPAGATFNPGITFSVTLSEEDWNQTVAGGQVPTIKWYNTTTSAWEDIPTTVNAATRTVTATITHFSTFAVVYTTGVLPTTTPTQVMTTAPTQVVMAAAITPAAPTEELPFMYVIIAIVAILIAVGVAFFFMKKNR